MIIERASQFPVAVRAMPEVEYFPRPAPPAARPTTLRAPAATPHPGGSPDADAQLGEALRRCSPETRDAARAYRGTGDLRHVPAIVRGVIERFTDHDRRHLLQTADPGLRLVEDLGLDSLTMMEIIMLAEEVLPLSISNDELRLLRTVGDVEQFITAKLRGEPAPLTSASGCRCAGPEASLPEKPLASAPPP